MQSTPREVSVDYAVALVDSLDDVDTCECDRNYISLLNIC